MSSEIVQLVAEMYEKQDFGSSRFSNFGAVSVKISDDVSAKVSNRPDGTRSVLVDGIQRESRSCEFTYPYLKIALLVYGGEQSSRVYSAIQQLTMDDVKDLST